MEQYWKKREPTLIYFNNSEINELHLIDNFRNFLNKIQNKNSPEILAGI